MSNDAEHEALIAAREFIADELECRRAGFLAGDDRSTCDPEHEPYLADAERVLALIDAALPGEDE